MSIFTDDFNAALDREIAADPIIRTNTRFGRLPLVMAADDAVFRAIVDGGRLLSPSDWTDDDERHAIRIAGSTEQWRIVLGLHGGLHRAWRYRLLTFSGDAVRMMTFWKSIWRVGAALQALAKGGE